MKNQIICPKCNNKSDITEWDKMTSDMCGDDFEPLKEGYGSMSWLYYCPCCFEFSSGSSLKNHNVKEGMV